VLRSASFCFCFSLHRRERGKKTNRVEKISVLFQEDRVANTHTGRRTHHEERRQKVKKVRTRIIVNWDPRFQRIIPLSPLVFLTRFFLSLLLFVFFLWGTVRKATRQGHLRSSFFSLSPFRECRPFLRFRYFPVLMCVFVVVFSCAFVVPRDFFLDFSGISTEQFVMDGVAQHSCTVFLHFLSLRRDEEHKRS